MRSYAFGLVLMLVAAFPGIAAADGVLVERISLDGTIEVHNCTQEPLVLRGDLLIVSRTVAGHSVFQFIFQGVEATSLGTGVEYVLAGSTTEVLHAGESGALVLSSRGSRLQLARGHAGVDFMTQAVVHFTVTPDGTPTASFEHGRFECREPA